MEELSPELTDSLPSGGTVVARAAAGLCGLAAITAVASAADMTAAAAAAADLGLPGAVTRCGWPDAAAAERRGMHDGELKGEKKRNQ